MVVTQADVLGAKPAFRDRRGRGDFNPVDLLVRPKGKRSICCFFL